MSRGKELTYYYRSRGPYPCPSPNAMWDGELLVIHSSLNGCTSTATYRIYQLRAVLRGISPESNQIRGGEFC